MRRVFLFGIILLAFLLRLRGISNPLLDDQAWRQADTASIALNMKGHLTDFPDVFFPRLMYDGAFPQKVELEFPFLPYLLAWTWSFFGWADYWGRLWSILFSLLALWGLYDLARHLLSERAALFAAGLFAVIPLAVYYGRTVMPESVAQVLSIWALALMRRWSLKEQKGTPIWPALFMGGAILAKLPQLMLLPVALIMGFFPVQRKHNKYLFAYLGVALFFPMVYYIWVHNGSPEIGRFVSGILNHQVAGNQVIDLSDLKRNLRQGINLGLVFLAIGGALLAIKRITVDLALFAWFGIAVIYVSVVCARIPLDYYLIPVVPVVCLLAAKAIDFLEDIPGSVSGAVVLGLLFYISYQVLTPKYDWNQKVLDQANWLNEHLPGQVIVLSDPQPMTFYYARTAGFRLLSNQLDEACKELKQSKANLLVILPETKQSPEFLHEISQEYPQIAPGIYKLK